jgi:CubicO group peptidase (beta-lactamase class C family)
MRSLSWLIAAYFLTVFSHTAKSDIPWPTDGWQRKSLESVGINPKAFKKFESFIFPKQRSTRAGWLRSDGLVLIKDGFLVYERYERGYDKDTLHAAWSVSKSYTNALIGLAVKDGLIDIEKPVRYYLRDYKDSSKKKELKVKHLLEMSSGIQWRETYESNPLVSSVIAMLFTRGFEDMSSFVAKKDVKERPGTYFEYSSGNTNFLLGLLKEVFERKEDQVSHLYNEYPYERLFKPLGIEEVVWEKDKAGTFVGSSWVFSTPRDMAKFGYLFLNEGVWEDQQLLPKGWVSYSATANDAFLKTPIEEPRVAKKRRAYGAHWWLNRDFTHDSMERAYPHAPNDLMIASGHDGQLIMISPSRDLVLVRTGDDHQDFDRNLFTKLLFESFSNDSETTLGGRHDQR